MSLWNLAQVDSAKQQLKSTLKAVAEAEGQAGKFEYLQSEIRRLEKSSASDDLLRLFIVVISALLLQKKLKRWTGGQIEKMVNLCYNILQMQKISAESSRLGFLYGEINLALSQIYRSDGQHFAAAWQQQLSQHLVKQKASQISSHQRLAAAIRVMRLGHLAKARDYFARANTGDLTAKQEEMAMINQLRCLRLLGRFDEHTKYRRNLIRRVDSSSASFQLELSWEFYCQKATATGELKAIINAVQKGGDHYHEAYLLESYLWAYASSERNLRSRLPRVSALPRRKELRISARSYSYRAVSCLESLHDTDIPLVLRLKELGGILANSQQFVAIERSWLFWIAAARWLAKSHAPELAAVVLQQYQGACLASSNGQSSDLLGLAGDLIARSWNE